VSVAVLAPEVPFRTVEERLAGAGFARDELVRPATPDAIPGEPELAAFENASGATLTYTFNPVVFLRVLEGNGAAVAAASGAVPRLDIASIRALLGESEPRRLLLGILAAQALQTRELDAEIAALRTHPSAPVARAAAKAVPPSGARLEALQHLRALCEQAVPVLTALATGASDSTAATLRPHPEDFARVFRADVAGQVQVAYELVWAQPPQVEERGALQLIVDAAPAGMLASDNELSRKFPGGYRALAPFLVENRIWFVWRYVRPPDREGTRYDGLVRLDDRWVWFPKPYRVVGELLRG
jgi:hypothetical protein